MAISLIFEWKASNFGSVKLFAKLHKPLGFLEPWAVLTTTVHCCSFGLRIFHSFCSFKNSSFFCKYPLCFLHLSQTSRKISLAASFSSLP